MAARLTACLLAVIVSAWLALGAVQSHDLTAGTNVATAQTIRPAQAAQGRSWLATAATLNPDYQVALTRAHLFNRIGHAQQAIALIEGVLRAEPRNLLAWYELATVAGGSHPRLLTRALAHIRLLAPPVRPAAS